MLFFFFKQKTAYEMRISDWSSDVCSSDLLLAALAGLVNAIGFLAFGHVFLASPDANATVLGANLPQSYAVALFAGAMVLSFVAGVTLMKIGRASCRERVCQYV